MPEAAQQDAPLTVAEVEEPGVLVELLGQHAEGQGGGAHDGLRHGTVGIEGAQAVAALAVMVAANG